ncbi:hypothetical protein BH10PSE7_BH10PSE7_01020 [soil metagenome]
MDWALAIEINHKALTRIVAALIALIEAAVEGAGARLPRSVHRAAALTLTRAEAAVRRLIVIAARGLVVTPRAARPMPAGLKITGSGTGCPIFVLFDPAWQFDFQPHRRGPLPIPRIHSFGVSPLSPLYQPQQNFPADASPDDDGLVNAVRLGRRLQAIRTALENLPAQAKRLARLKARRAGIAPSKFRLILRPGPPPGHRRQGEDDIDRVLRECHGLARDALAADTS